MGQCVITEQKGCLSLALDAFIPTYAINREREGEGKGANPLIVKCVNDYLCSLARIW